MNLNRKTALASILALSAAVAFAAVGCGDDSTSTPAKDAGGGGTDSGNPGTDAGKPGTDAGGGTDAGPTQTLYQKVGGRAGVAAAVDAVFAAEAADAQILSYFAIRTPGVSGWPAATSPSLPVIKDCFTQLVAGVAGGPEQYTQADGNAPYIADGGFSCRDMGSSHAGLHITPAAFQKFFAIAATTLASPPFSLSANDLAPLSAGLSAGQGQIIDATRDAGPDAATYSARCADIDGGQTDGGPAAAVCDTY